MSANKLGVIIDLARAEREYLRWVILLALWSSRPHGATENVILRACCDIPLWVTLDELRREIKSIAKHGLATVTEGPVWQAEITAAGEDVVNYRADTPLGIARPPRW